MIVGTLLARHGARLCPVVDQDLDSKGGSRYVESPSTYPPALFRVVGPFKNDAVPVVVERENPTTFRTGTRFWLSLESLRRCREVPTVCTES